MRFSLCSLVVLSSLFFNAFATPNTPGAQARGLNSEVASLAGQKRAAQDSVSQVAEILQTLLDEVKTHTGAINASIAQPPEGGNYSADQRTAIQKSAQNSTMQIVGSISRAVSAISDVPPGQAVGADLGGVVMLLVMLILEVVYTLLALVEALVMTVGEILAGVLPILVHIIVVLLMAVGIVLGDVIALVLAILTPVLGLVGSILTGLTGFLSPGAGAATPSIGLPGLGQVGLPSGLPGIGL